MSKQRTLTLVALAAVVLSCSGCAFLNRDNTPLLNGVERCLWPGTTGKRMLAAPVVVPIGLVAVVVDAVVVHPISVVDDAAADAKEQLWSDMKWNKEFVSECTWLPWRTVFTPVVFGVTFVVRSLFDVPDRAEKERKRAEQREALVMAEKEYDAGRYKEALKRLAKIQHRYLDAKQAIRAGLMQLDSARRCGQYEFFTIADRRCAQDEDARAEIVKMLDEMERLPDAHARRVAYRAWFGLAQSQEEREAVIMKGLEDADAIVRNGAISWAGQHWRPRRLKPLLEVLDRIAKEDPAVINRAFAAQVARQLKSIGDKDAMMMQRGLRSVAPGNY